MNTRMRSSILTLLVALCALVVGVRSMGAGQPVDAPTGGPFVFLPLISRSPTMVVLPRGQGFSQVTAITHGGDERLFVGQRTGEIFTLGSDGEKSMFLDLSSWVDSNGSEHRLYDIAIHPDFAANGLFFITYSTRVDGRVYLVLGRFHVKPGMATADPASEATLLRIRQDTDLHKGGGLDFDRRDRLLYMGIGEDTQIALAQDRASLKGKVIRIAVDDVPAELTGNAEGRARVETWALGFRNPWRLDVDEPTGLIYVADVGSGSWEEVNVAPASSAGVNFGWPCREGAYPFIPGNDVVACHEELTLTDPLYAFSHEEGRCAIIGGSVYRPATNAADGRYIFGELCTRSIFALATGSTAADPTMPLGIVSEHALLTLGEDNQGNLYAGDSDLSGPIFKLILP